MCVCIVKNTVISFVNRYMRVYAKMNNNVFFLILS